MANKYSNFITAHYIVHDRIGDWAIWYTKDGVAYAEIYGQLFVCDSVEAWNDMLYVFTYGFL